VSTKNGTLHIKTDLGFSAVWNILDRAKKSIDPLTGKIIAEDASEGFSSIQEHSRWPEFHARIADCCERTWRSVSDVLCNDTPEGLFLADADVDETPGTKESLSYSWRAIHESRLVSEAL
jgi:hypothetical protein